MDISKIKALRTEYGVTQAELASHSGIDMATISRAESGYLQLKDSAVSSLESGIKSVLRERANRINRVMQEITA